MISLSKEKQYAISISDKQNITFDERVVHNEVLRNSLISSLSNTLEAQYELNTTNGDYCFFISEEEYIGYIYVAPKNVKIFQQIA
jgi:hypothetical protein